MNTIRAKFQCIAMNRESGNNIVTLHAVMGGSKENETFFQYTPSGSVTLNLVQDSTANFFEEGKEYYLDFTAVAAPEAAAMDQTTPVVPPPAKP